MIGKCNHVKGLPPFRDDFPVFPDRVRHDEIQQSAFFRRFLLFKQPVHVPREFEQLYTGLHILAVRRPYAINLRQNTGLLLPILRRFALEQAHVDPAVEPVFVHHVEALLEAQVVCLELGYRFIAEALLVAVALAQGLADPRDDSLVDGDAPEHRAVSFFERLLPDVRLRASSPRAGTVVVDIFLFLNFADHGEAAGTALQHSGERKTMPGFLCPLAESVIQRGLRGQPKVTRHYRIKSSGVAFAAPVKFPGVDTIAQNLTDGGFVDRPPASEVFLMGDGCKFLDGVLTSRAQVVKTAHQRGQGRVGDNRALAVCAVHIDVSNRRVRRPDALRSLLDHAFAGFLAEIVDEVFRHEHFDAVDEFFGGARFIADYGSFLDEMNLQPFEFVYRHPIAKIAVETIRFFDEQDSAVRILAQISNHRIETAAARAFRRFNIGECSAYLKLLFVAVGSQQLILRRNRKAFFRLFLRGNAGIEHRASGGVFNFLRCHVFSGIGSRRVRIDPIVPAVQ